MVEPLTITKTEGQVHVLHLAGKLDAQTQALLTQAAMAEQAAGARYLLIDLHDVDFIASAGLAALHNVYKMFTPAGEAREWENQNPGEPYKSAYVKLAGAAPAVYYVLNIAGFLQNIPIYPDLQGALQSFPA